MEVKEILFENKKTGNDYFDLVTLDYIQKLKPIGHNQFEYHKISFYIIVLITDGTGRHGINYQEYDYQKGTIFTLRKNTVHKFYQAQSRGKFLLFTEDFVARFWSKTEALHLFQLFNEMLGSPSLQLGQADFTEIEDIVNKIEQEYLNKDDDHSIEIIRSLIQVLIHKLFRIKAKGKQGFGKQKSHLQFVLLQELVEKECFDHKKVSYYAAKMGVTSRTLNNITQKVTGKSAKSFIDEVLIVQIKRLINSSDISFTEIAYRSGFDEPTNFFKYFRKKTGLSPKQFKETFR